jgi:8-oxo-dGTP pyrophosphatase MutT (NUDIX family)
MPPTLTLADVERALRQPLPGLAAQMRMSTLPRATGLRPQEEERPPHRGAVLALLYPAEGQLLLPLTRRTDRVATHKGQISFPGGAQDEGDGSLWETARREAQEEVGIDPSSLRCLGALSPLYIPASHFQVQPYVGYLEGRPLLVPNAEEVAEIIEFPLAALLDDALKDEETWELHDHPARVPFYRYQGNVIWGATAMMLSELEALLRLMLG